MSNMKNIPGKIYLQIGDECDSEDFNELSEVSWCKDKIYDNDIEYTLQKQMDNITEKEIEKLSEERYPVTDIIGNWLDIPTRNKQEGYIEGYKAALQNKVSDVNAEKIKQRILEAYYDGFNQAHYSHVHPEICEPKECESAGKEYMIKKEKLINSDLEEYASIVNERKDNAGSCETSNEVLNEVLGIAVKAHLFQQLNQMDDFIEEIEKFKNFEIRKKQVKNPIIYPRI